MGGKSRKSGGISRRLIEKIKAGGRLGKTGKKQGDKKQGADPFGLSE
jgi:hypothetical protein